MSLINIAEVNSFSNEQFESLFRNVIELHPRASIQTKNRRPFHDVTELCAAFNEYLDQLSVKEKLEVLKLHPDLAGRLARQGELTPESAAEQQAAGLEELTPQQRSIVDYNNQRYKDKFGFTFIICAKENKIQAIIEGLQSRYNNSYEEEIENAINEVKKICKLRILSIVKN